ncbi:hypothetical protein K2173_000639 [Erythroxylum novogranatense]|uniref:Uncharacterized protein n=1 Tax=Erythroxylum novogranatense TaxID=1862640 RepID=A0AAV8S861_9ROSI|nr:hypothetical protein K2173_000639 [Erythroxylum novogranatense]
MPISFLVIYVNRKWCLKYEGNDYLRQKVLVDDDIVQEVSAVSAVGTLIKVDRQTSISTKGHFSRVCVELNLEQPLVPKVFIGCAWRRGKYEGILGVYSGCGRVNHSIENCPEKVVPEKIVSNTIAKNQVDSLQVEDRVVIKVDKGSVGPSKRISSASGPVGLRGPLVVTRSKATLEVGQSSRPNVEGMVSDISDHILIVDSHVPSFLALAMPVLPVLDNVSDGVMAKFVSLTPKPPDPITGDVIVGAEPMALTAALAHNVSYAVDGVGFSTTDEDISTYHSDYGGHC